MATQIADLPVAPSRSDEPAVFIVNADAWVADLQRWTDDVNVVSQEVEDNANAASDSADAATASANYKGKWDDLTGALNIPASVSHIGLVWLLEVNLADVTLSEPGITSDWLNLSPTGIGKFTIYTPSRASTSRDTDGAADGSFETTTNKIMVVTKDFDPAVDEFVQFDVEMPKSWNEGVVTARLIWSHAATTVNFDTAWAVQAMALSNDEAIDTAFGTAVVVTDTGGVTDRLYITPESGNITIANSPSKNDWVVFQVFRDVSADAMAIDSRLVGLHVIYTTDTDTDD